MTYTFMIAVSQYVQFSFSVRVWPCPSSSIASRFILFVSSLLVYCSLYSSDEVVKLFAMIKVGLEESYGCGISRRQLYHPDGGRGRFWC